MNALVVYYSLFGNTHKVTQAIADSLRQAGDVRLVEMGELTVADLQGVDLLVIGAPTHVMNVPKEVRPVLDALPRRALAGVAYAAFDTSYEMSWWLRGFTASRRLSQRMRRLGGRRIVPPENFLVERTHEGPLYEGEIERAQAWAERIMERMVQRAAA